MQVTITPLDTVFIRDGRAFGVNDAHAADSLFPPPPRVVFGAWRGAILTQGGYQLSDWTGVQPTTWPGWFGGSKDAGLLRQKGPVLCLDRQKLLFPLPHDVVFMPEMDSKKDRLEALNLAPIPQGSCSLGLSHCLYLDPHKGRQPKLKDQIYITGDKLTAYLAWDRTEALPLIKDQDYFLARDLWGREERVNVGILPETHAHRPGALFSLGHVRLSARLSLFCTWDKAEGDPDAQTALTLMQDKANQLINLGGDKRAARVQPMDSDLSWPSAPQLMDQPDQNSWRFSLYLATPASLGGGWLPGSAASGQVSLKSDEVEIEATMVAAAVGKPYQLGGYDIAGNRQRAMRRMVPAGSVYVLETSEPWEKVAQLHATNIGDQEFMRAQGFGLALLGLIPAK